MFIERTVVLCANCGEMAAARRTTVANAPDIVKHKPPQGWETKLGTDNTVHLCPKCAKERRRREAHRRYWAAVKRALSFKKGGRAV